MLLVQRLAGILLEMQPLDADGNGFAATTTSPSPTSGDLYWLI